MSATERRILVDTSVWIDLFRKEDTRQVALLRTQSWRRNVVVGDLILCEMLMGARTEKQAGEIEAELRRFPIVALSSVELAVDAARHYRTLRGMGLTVRKLADLLIATFCIAHGHALLHRDRDFDVMERHLGLQVLRA